MQFDLLPASFVFRCSDLLQVHIFEDMASKWMDFEANNFLAHRPELNRMGNCKPGSFALEDNLCFFVQLGALGLIRGQLGVA